MIAVLMLLCLQDPAQPEKLPLPKGIRESPRFSPDGNWIYYYEKVKTPANFDSFTNNWALFRTSLDGRTVRKILEVGILTSVIQFHPDGKRLALTRHAADTDKSGKVGFDDGDSLWIGDLDGRNARELISGSNRKVFLEAILEDGRFVLGYRNDYSEAMGKVVLRSETGEDQSVCDASEYAPVDDDRGFIKLIEKDSNRSGGIDFDDDPTYYFYSLKDRKRGARLEDEHMLRAPLLARGKLWYTRRIDSNSDGKFNYQDTSVLVVCDPDGKNRKDLTDGKENVLVCFEHGEGILAMVWRQDDGEFFAISDKGVRKRVWSSRVHTRVPVVSPDGKRIAFMTVRDTTGDGKAYYWEDESDLHLLDLKGGEAPRVEPGKPQKLALKGGIRERPTFSPDGKWIYYFEQTKAPANFAEFVQHQTLFRTRLDGRTVEKIVEVGIPSYTFAWHPDGRQFAILRHREDTNGDGKVDYEDGDSAWMVDVDGGNPREIVKSGNRDLSLYGILRDGRVVLGFRAKLGDVKASFVARTESGEETVLGEGYSLTIVDDKTAFLYAIEKDTNGDQKLTYDDEGTYYWFSIAQRKRLAALGDDHIVTPPVVSGGRLWYPRRVDSNGDRKFDWKDNTMLVTCDLDGGHRKELTKGLEYVYTEFAYGGGMLCSVWRADETDMVVFSSTGTREMVWSSRTPSRYPSLSPDGKRLLFTMIRDTNGDKEFYDWEDESDLYLLDLKK